MRTLVTGSTGFFGTWTAKALQGDVVLADRNNFREMLNGRYDYIYHFAPTPIESIIECAAKTHAKIFYASSGAVYGGLRVKVNEDHPTNPVTDYGIEKLRNELVLKKSGLKYCIGRLFTFCGQGMRDYFAITAFVKALKENKPLIVLSDPIRTYMYIEDAVRWIIYLTENETGVYNIGSEKEISIAKLALRVSSYCIPRCDIIRSEKKFHDPAPYYVPDCSKAHEVGLYEKYDLDYGLRKMING